MSLSEEGKSKPSMVEEVEITLDMDTSLRSSDIDDLLRSLILPYPNMVRATRLLFQKLDLLGQKFGSTIDIQNGCDHMAPP
jgi:hypothetical protein